MPVIEDADRVLKKKEPTVNFSVRIAVPLKARLQALAKHRGVPPSEIINFLLEAGVEQLEKQWGVKK
jgi:predicted DNA-binding protein